jgi:hypothetical protein
MLGLRAWNNFLDFKFWILDYWLRVRNYKLGIMS